jgi:hypothetical protein
MKVLANMLLEKFIVNNNTRTRERIGKKSIYMTSKNSLMESLLNSVPER